MFTGIVEELGTVAHLERDGERARLEIAAGRVVDDAAIGDSIAVSGCCLTVTELTARGFAADLMAATLAATALGDLQPGDEVNLERAMRADTRFGGHLVQGHVDGVGRIVAREEQPGTVFLTVEAPADLDRYLVAKGSVTVAGISLTIVDLPAAATFRIGIIPHTLMVTTLGGIAVGAPVNLEVDVIAKYVERLVRAGVSSPYVPTPAPEVTADA